MKNSNGEGFCGPVLSVGIILVSLMIIVGMRMEERRMGYEVLNKTRLYRKTLDQKRVTEMNYAKMTSPNILKRVAVSKLTMEYAQRGQVIYLGDQGLAVPH